MNLTSAVNALFDQSTIPTSPKTCVAKSPDHQLLCIEVEYITVTLHAALKQLKSQATQMFVQPFIPLFQLTTRKTSKLHMTGAFVRGIPVDSLHKGPVKRKSFPGHDIIMDIERSPRNLICMICAPSSTEWDWWQFTDWIFLSQKGNWTRMSGSRLQHYLQTSGPCFKMKCTGNPIVEIRWS